MTAALGLWESWTRSATALSLCAMRNHTGHGKRRQTLHDALVRMSALVLTSVLPGFVHAEGAVRVLECTVTMVCDAAGQCAGAAEPVSFRIEPLEVAETGPARYAINHGETQAEMQALTDAGPFFWMHGSERATLLASSETQWVWHRLVLEPRPSATISFLTCAFRQ